MKKSQLPQEIAKLKLVNVKSKTFDRLENSVGLKRAGTNGERNRSEEMEIVGGTEQH